MTRKAVDTLHEQYCRLVAVAENNIGEPSEASLWERADHFWERVVLPAKYELEMEYDQHEMDAAQADLLDLQESLEMDTWI